MSKAARPLTRTEPPLHRAALSISVRKVPFQSPPHRLGRSRRPSLAELKSPPDQRFGGIAAFVCALPGDAGASPSRGKARERGSALLLVLWALILLSAAVIAWSRWIQQDILLSGQGTLNMEARAMAHSGVAMALHPLVSEQSPQLQKEFGSALGYRVQIVGEGGKLNINWLLAGEEPRKIAIFKKWLDQMGLDFQQRETFVDSLLDYVDADNVKRLNGAEDEGDYVVPNRPLLDPEEITRVRGSQALTRVPGWKENLTRFSAGPVDLLAAPRDVLRTLPGFGDALIDRFIVFRNGKDGILGTKDDPVFKSLRDVQLFLGMTEAQFKTLGGLVAIKDPVVHITAQGQSGKVIRQLEVVARKSGGNPAILFWNE